ncbi:unnamed protein product [Parajaminaea phylloscopi]
MSDLSKLKVTELKAELSSLGLSTLGLKAELVARLQEHVDSQQAQGGEDEGGDANDQTAAAVDAEQDDGADQGDGSELKGSEDISQPAVEQTDASETVSGASNEPAEADEQEQEQEQPVHEEVEVPQLAAEPPVASTDSVENAPEQVTNDPAAAPASASDAQPTPAEESVITSEWLAKQVLTEDDSQIAGHPGGVRKVVGPTGEALIIKDSLPSEARFYTDISSKEQRAGESNKQADKRRSLARDWTPKFYGSVATEGDAARCSVALQDLLAPYNKANVLDIKLGTQLWDEADATEEKKERMEKAARDTTSYETGLRLTGWRTWDADKAEYHTVAKAFGKHIAKEQLGLGLRGFFGQLRGESLEKFAEIQKECSQNGSGVEEDQATGEANEQNEGASAASGPPRLDSQAITTMIEKHFLPQLNRLVALFSTLEVRIRGGSLLVVFEGSLDALRSNLKAPRDAVQSGPPALAIRLIDFAHARLMPGEGPDQGVLKGLRTLQSLLREEVLRSQDAVALPKLSEEDVSRLPSSRALRLEGLVRPLNLQSLRQRCLEVANEGVEAEEQLDESFGEDGVWLDAIKSSGWVVFSRASAADRVREACHGKMFPTSESFRIPVQFFPVHAETVHGFLQREQREWELKKTKPQILVRLSKEEGDEEPVFFLRSNQAEQKIQQLQRGKDPKQAGAAKRKDFGQGNYSQREHRAGEQASKYRRRDDYSYPPGPMQTSIRGVASFAPPGDGYQGDLGGRMGGYGHGPVAHGGPYHRGYDHRAREPPSRSAYLNDDPTRPPLPQAASMDLDPRPTLRMEKERDPDRNRGWDRSRTADRPYEAERPRPPRSDYRDQAPAHYAPRAHGDWPAEPSRSTRGYYDDRQSERVSRPAGPPPSREVPEWQSQQGYNRPSERKRAGSPGWMDPPSSSTSSFAPPTRSAPHAPVTGPPRDDRRERGDNYYAARDLPDRRRRPEDGDGRAPQDVGSRRERGGNGPVGYGMPSQDDYYSSRVNAPYDRRRLDDRPPPSSEYARGGAGSGGGGGGGGAGGYGRGPPGNDRYGDRSRGGDGAWQREGRWAN